jgi:hypothetical protein
MTFTALGLALAAAAEPVFWIDRAVQRVRESGRKGGWEVPPP